MVQISSYFMLMTMIVHLVEATYYTEKHRTLVVPRENIGLEVNADKTKYMVMFPDQNAGKSQYKD